MSTKNKTKGRAAIDLPLVRRSWDTWYPNWRADFQEIFGTESVSLSKIMSWKSTWESKIGIPVGSQTREEILDRCKQLKIHPIFWQLSLNQEEEYTIDYDTGQPMFSSRITKRVIVFFFDDDHLAYKLAYQ